MSASHRSSLECLQYDHLVSKKRCKSHIWVHFGIPADSCGKILNENISICKHCKRSVSAKGGSTSNLFSHIKVHHPVHYKDLCSSTKQTLVSPAAVHEINIDNPSTSIVPKFTNEVFSESPIRKKQKIKHYSQSLNSVSSKNCTLFVTKFLTTTLQPYNLIEHKAFIDMLNFLNPNYKLPGRKHFTQIVIPRLYNNTITKIQQLLITVKNSEISITTDCWTSMAGIPYIAVTLHFINEEWESKSFCLKCAHFEEDSTSENIAEVLTDILADWGFSVKELASCTADNNANILKALHCLNVPHIPCFGHTIEMGVNKALKLPQIKEAIMHLKKLQSTMAYSNDLKYSLAKTQEFLKMDVVELPNACESGWWSTLKLCCRFLDNQLPLFQMLQDNSKKYLMPEESQISAIEDFVAATKILMDVTTTLSGEDYIIASSILPVYRKIKKYLQPKENDSELMLKVKFETLSPLCQKYEREPLLSMLRICTLCDPRFRLNFMDSVSEVRENVILELINIYSQFSEDTTEIVKPTTTMKKGLTKLLQDEDDTDESLLNPIRKAEAELNNYLAMPKVSLDENPLTWWKMHENSFPGIKVLAKKFLAIQGTSVPSERIFCTGSDVINKNRTSLSPKNAEMRVFLALNKNII